MITPHMYLKWKWLLQYMHVSSKFSLWTQIWPVNGKPVQRADLSMVCSLHSSRLCYAAFDNFNVFIWLVVVVGLNHAHATDDLHAGADAPENTVLPVQPLGRRQGNEELTAVRVWTRIGHWQDTSSCNELTVLTPPLCSSLKNNWALATGLSNYTFPSDWRKNNHLCA